MSRAWICALLYLAINAASTAYAAGPPGGATVELLTALSAVTAEADATAIMAPHMEELKTLDSRVVEKIVMKQWWGLARDIIAKSHIQRVDLSFAVRKAVRVLKDEADELLRTLNPKYGVASQVSPAFQWAQNDTSVFLTIKYTVRWNAPGALEVTDPNVIITGNTFNFTGEGKHSNNKYKYTLSLKFFDNLSEPMSTWSTASVGKLSVTLRKKWPRKWPRLLANKKAKITNMHVWMEMQEKLDSSLGGQTTASNSPVTCAAAEKLYCLATDTCKKSANCSQCPGKPIPKVEESLCSGMPGEKASISFSDSDMGENELGGELKINKARHEFDIDHYMVYFGKDERSKLEMADGKPYLIGSVVPTGSDTELNLPMNTALPEGATHVLVFSKNEYGEYAIPGNSLLTDAVLPKSKPGSMQFEDEDGEVGEVSGTVTIGRAADESRVNDYALHWGRTATRKLHSASFIRDVPKQNDGDPTHYIARNTKIPDHATHLLAYTKNEHGEHPSTVSLKIVDNTKPCREQDAENCPVGVFITGVFDAADHDHQAKVQVVRAADEEDVSHYSLYWGRSNDCEGGQAGAKNGHIKDLEKGDADLEWMVPQILPTTTKDSKYVLVFSKNKYGESEFCRSAELENLVKLEL